MFHLPDVLPQLLTLPVSLPSGVVPGYPNGWTFLAGTVAPGAEGQYHSLEGLLFKCPVGAAEGTTTTPGPGRRSTGHER
jgi:hypothetical protein